MTSQEMRKIVDLEKKLNDFMLKSGNSDASMSKDIEHILKAIGEIKKLLSDHYVTQTEFKPIKTLVYGVVGLILTSVVTVGLSFFLKQ